MTRPQALAGAGIAAIVVAIVLVLTLGSSGGSSGRGQPLALELDFFPNADHAAIYAARAAGYFRRERLDVGIHAPSDPATPLKLLAAGKTDLAISYEPEVLLARAQNLPVVAVAALIRTPLTAIISLPKAGIRAPADLRGKRIGTAGIAYQDAYLTAVLRRAGVPRSSVSERNVGFNLVPALIAGEADAILGGYWNYEAIELRLQHRDPRVIRIEQAGVPSYDELVIVANRRTLRAKAGAVRRFLVALDSGAHDLARRPARAVAALLASNRDLDPRLQRASAAVTLPYMLPPPGRPYGYMDPAAWDAFAAFMERSGVLAPRVRGSAAMTDALLPPT